MRINRLEARNLKVNSNIFELYQEFLDECFFTIKNSALSSNKCVIIVKSKYNSVLSDVVKELATECQFDVDVEYYQFENSKLTIRW